MRAGGGGRGERDELGRMSVNWAALEDPVIIGRLILQVVLFMASATFSMSETALFSLRESDVDRLEEKNAAKAGRVRALLDEPRQLIVSILCGNELVNIAATINLTGILLVLLGNPEAAGVVNAVVMVPLLLIFSEITPKTLAVTMPVPLVSRIVEPVLTVWVKLVMPLRYVVRQVAERVTNLIIGEHRDERNILGADEFQTFLRAVEKDGVVSAGERRLINNLIDAGSAPVTEIMVPRPQVSFIDATLPVPDMIERFRRLRHRRVPIYRETRDNIVGMLKEERVLEVVSRMPRGAITLEDLAEPPTLVPTACRIWELAEFFKRGDHHAVLLVNEFGGIEGLVSADDVFGYLTRGRGVYLEPHTEIDEVEEGVFRCRGLTPIGTISEATGIPIGTDAGMTTVGGLVMALLNRVAEEGDEVSHAGYTFRVLGMKKLLVGKVLIAPEGHAALTRERDEPALPGLTAKEAAE